MVYTGDLQFFKYASSLIERVIDDDREIITWAAIIKGYKPKGEYCIYNTEDLHIKDKLIRLKPYINNASVVYDYSINNLKFHNGKYAPIQLFDDRCINEHSIKKTNDILFYGMITPRRKKILDSLYGKVSVIHKESKPIHELKDFINKSKYVLSMGSYDNTNNDSFRIIPALEHGATVIAERTTDPMFDDNIGNGVLFEDYNNLTDRILKLCM
jgi:hypothetical protein